MPGPLRDVEQSCGSKSLQFSRKYPLIGRYNPKNCRLSGLQDVFKYSFDEFRAVLFDFKAQIAIKKHSSSTGSGSHSRSRSARNNRSTTGKGGKGGTGVTLA